MPRAAALKSNWKLSRLAPVALRLLTPFFEFANSMFEFAGLGLVVQFQSGLATSLLNMLKTRMAAAKPKTVVSCLVAFSAPLLTLGFLTALKPLSDIRARAVPGTRRDVLEELAREPADILLLGVQLNCGSSVQRLLQLLRTEPHPPRALVFVPRVAARLCPVLRSAGAAGTVAMETKTSEVGGIVRACFQGRPVPAPCGEDPRAETTAGSVDLSLLTACETEIFNQIGTGDSPRVIAARLGISPKTVEAHRANIKSKLGIRNAEALNRIAQAWKLWESSGSDWVI